MRNGHRFPTRWTSISRAGLARIRDRLPKIWRKRVAIYEHALALDPSNIEAMVGTANVDLACLSIFLTDDRAARAAAAEATLTKVLSLAPNHALAQYLLGGVHILTNRAAEGIAKCEHALALDRNLAAAHSLIGLAKYFTGRAEETESHVLEALRLSPRDTNAYIGCLSPASPSSISAATRKPPFGCSGPSRPIEIFPSHFYLAAARAHLGRMSEARAAAKAGLALNPTFTIRRFRAALRATIRPISRNASASTMACARPGCRKNERSVIFPVNDPSLPAALDHRGAQQCVLHREGRRRAGARLFLF